MFYANYIILLVVKVKAFVVKHAYWFFLAGLSALFAVACFGDIDRWLCLYIAVCSVLFTPEQLVTTIFIMFCFDGLIFNYSYVLIYLFCLLVTQFAYQVFAHRRSVTQRPLMVLLVLCAVIMLRMWTGQVRPIMALYRIISFGLFYLVYAWRDQFNFGRVLRVVSIGLIISGVLGLLYYVSPWLRSLFVLEPAENGNSEYVNVYYRYQGLTCHSTQYAGLGATLLCALLLAKYKKQINDYWFYGLFVPIYIFTYQSLTRTFLLVIVIALMVFAVFCVLRDRKQAWRTLVPLAGVLVAVSVVFFTATLGFWERIFHDDAMVNDYWGVKKFTEADWEAIKQGDGTYARKLGRADMWPLYWQDFTQSITNLLFGRGVGHFLFAGYTPHNWYIYFPWRYGLVGVVLFGVMMGLMFNWRLVRQKRYWQRVVPLLILLLPMLVQAVFDDNGFWAQLTIILAIMWCYEQSQPAKLFGFANSVC